MNSDDLLSCEAWAALAPSLHIADPEFLRPAASAPLALDRDNDLAGPLRHEGYVQLRGLDLGLDFTAMARVARTLSAAGLDPVFAFVYDEFWRPFFRLDALYRQLLGTYTFLPNFWAWNVDPQRGGAGWRPHRDQGAGALLPDGSPKSLTTWIAVTEANPLNGCLYIVPAHDDPTYGTAEDGNWRFDHASIRALPAKPGDVLMWNQAVLHWGGKSSPRGAQSRVSISLEAQRLDVPLCNAPAIAPWEIVPFELRLKLIGEKILHYRHMHDVDPAVEAIAVRISE